MTDNSERMPVFFIPHGGGPCFFMEWTMGPPDSWDRLKNYLASVKDGLPRKPESILIVSAHWEERAFTVGCKQQPEMFFDYYGFPEHTYKLNYPAPGNPALAERIFSLLNEGGVECRRSFDRDFDHGVFIPLMVMFPEADIPVTMLSLKVGLSPEEHMKAGMLLQSLRSEGVLIIGSGLNYHNMQGFMQSFALEDSKKFNGWLSAAVEKEPGVRNRMLAEWIKAPSAEDCHPREEHLIPLMFCSGASEESGRVDFSDVIMNSEMCAYRFG